MLGRRLLPAITAAAREHCLARHFEQATIGLSALGGEAVALGAATLAVQDFLSGSPAEFGRRRSAS